MSGHSEYRARIAIVGGATAGAEVAGKLSELGALCVVFEQNARPYGKVEDGLPAWHVALRKKEYDLIDGKLGQSGVHFVPRTTVGRDVGFRELTEDWGFDAVVLAHGAWRDRPLPLPDVDRFVDKGLVYQNAFIQWFNHRNEIGYTGPRYQVEDGALVVGGGLASIDVVKVLQLEMAVRRLAERGIDQDLNEMEVHGIPATLAKHGIKWEDLKIAGCTLYYRRRIEDMPLAEAPPKASPEQMTKIEGVRRRILEKAQSKYLFHVEQLWAPTDLLLEGDRLTGVRFTRTRVNERGSAEVAPGGEVRDVLSPLIISSIGSIPEPIEGLAMSGELIQLEDLQLGKVVGYSNVFSCGNAVTGKGNLVASRKHSSQVATHVADQLDLGRNGERFVSTEALLARVRARQQQVGYDGDYRGWIDRATPEAAT